MSSLTQLATDVRRTLKRRVKRRLTSPFKTAARRVIVHSTYHKMGTKWFTNVLHGVANRYGLRFRAINDGGLSDEDGKRDVVVFNHSDLVAQRLDGSIGTHMVRDLRDVVVSGYFYHLWTKEDWAHEPSRNYNGQSYQQYLKGLGQADGIHAEIDRFASYAEQREMRQWNYNSANFLELKYEDIFGKERAGFRRVFQHLGFTTQAVEECVGIADSFSFAKVASQDENSSRSHLRSGQSGQWENLFDDGHKQHFKERLGDLLQTMGYASDNNW